MSTILKAIVLAAILGMLFPVAGHAVSRSLASNWIRFGISIIFLIVSITVSYFIASTLHWGMY